MIPYGHSKPIYKDILHYKRVYDNRFRILFNKSWISILVYGRGISIRHRLPEFITPRFFCLGKY